MPYAVSNIYKNFLIMESPFQEVPSSLKLWISVPSYRKLFILNDLSIIMSLRGVFEPYENKEEEKIFGREKEIKEVEKRLRSKKPVMIMGFRRVGKSTVAYAAARRFARERVAHIYCSNNLDSDRFQELVERQFRRIITQESKTRGASFEGGIPFAKASVEESHTWTYEFSIEDYCNDNCVIILDEVHKINNPNVLKDILKFSRDHLRNARIILTGSSLPYMVKLFEKFKVQKTTIFPFDHDTAIEFMERGFGENGCENCIDYDYIYSVVGGAPGHIIDVAEEIIIENKGYSEAVMSVYYEQKEKLLEDINKLFGYEVVDSVKCFLGYSETNCSHEIIEHIEKLGYAFDDPFVRKVFEEWVQSIERGE